MLIREKEQEEKQKKMTLLVRSIHEEGNPLSILSILSVHQLLIYGFGAATWDPDHGNGSVPELKGAKWFSFEELRKCTQGFSESNCIGFGGYGKVCMLAVVIINYNAAGLPVQCE